MIKTLDDVISEICDVAGIYGAHDDDGSGNIDLSTCGPELKKMCRICAESYLRTEIESALDIERRLAGTCSREP